MLHDPTKQIFTLVKYSWSNILDLHCCNTWVSVHFHINEMCHRTNILNTHVGTASVNKQEWMIHKQLLRINFRISLFSRQKTACPLSLPTTRRWLIRLTTLKLTII